jgi:DNA invertase Pin-like site-specific DNA recombinase
MQRYSNLDSVSKIFQQLCAVGLISPDGRPVDRPDRSRPPTEPDPPFKLDQRLKPEILAEIVARYEAGESSTAIATVFHLSKNSVIRLLREADVPIRRQGLTEEQIDEAAALYESGLSLAKIGAHLGVDHGTVWHQLKKLGVRMRDTHGRER